MSDVTRRLSANKGPAPRPVLERPPESFRTDRDETVASVGLGPTERIDHGLNFECLVGKFNEARNLATGLATLDRGCKPKYPTHLFAESVTLLSGSVGIDVEGRRYSLRVLGNVVIPRVLAHAVQYASSEQPILHPMMARSTPTRMPVDKALGSLGAPRFGRKNR